MLANKKRVYPEGTPAKSKGYDADDLLDTLSIILTGIEFEKFEELMTLTNRQHLSTSTFYRYQEIVKIVFQEEWKKEVYRLCCLIFENEEEISLSIDGHWGTRGTKKITHTVTHITISED